MNKVVLIGRITKDADFVQLDDGTRGVAKFTLAVNRSFPKKNGERDTDFISVVYWSNHADKISPHLTKGKLIGVSGKIVTRSYTTENGSKKYITQVEADGIQFLGSKKEDAV
ncbi:single-stranded DNA-binding protein [Clostridium thailandense]|uniref:Single-stranded DNA-binding protein n=1 Tax=Clostridium thailandense TaxID=2794346 RepID=A0A949TRY2_9CLOT|nr:single-stranded DNA-binding protein [Clostridium thailandense]MBV7272231.1 single-stranded DNA-binding protein [Clostridium thailandense]MCH5136484.1 single-stranded DNA-binding protein [Clostridiaceae bacterium UIB06]